MNFWATWVMILMACVVLVSVVFSVKGSETRRKDRETRFMVECDEIGGRALRKPDGEFVCIMLPRKEKMT